MPGEVEKTNSEYSLRQTINNMNNNNNTNRSSVYNQTLIEFTARQEARRKSEGAPSFEE
jgi:hypothetical protein